MGNLVLNLDDPFTKTAITWRRCCARKNLTWGLTCKACRQTGQMISINNEGVLTEHVVGFDVVPYNQADHTVRMRVGVNKETGTPRPIIRCRCGNHDFQYSITRKEFREVYIGRTLLALRAKEGAKHRGNGMDSSSPNRHQSAKLEFPPTSQ